MRSRSLGGHGLEVSAVGYSAMVLTGCYGAVGLRLSAEHLAEPDRLALAEP
jgi:hypothetical protein